MDNDGIPHGDREQTVHSAGRVCNYLGAGRGVTGAIVGVSIGNPPMNLIDAQNFVAIARAYYTDDGTAYEPGGVKLTGMQGPIWQLYSP